MDNIRVLRTYWVEFGAMRITRLTDYRAEFAMKFYPKECFDSAFLAQSALREYYKNLRDIAQQQVIEAFKVVPVKDTL